MSVSFARINDYMIHDQAVTRWAKEMPCDGIIIINDAASTNPVLRQAYTSAAESQGKKGLVWTPDHFKDVQEKVLTSSCRYFLITRNPLDTKKILIDIGFVSDDVKTIATGPGNDRPGAIKSDNNQSFTSEEGEAFETTSKVGYTVKPQLLPDVKIETWDKHKNKSGF